MSYRGRRSGERNIPRCARCWRPIGLDDSPVSCNRCNREDEEKKKAAEKKAEQEEGGKP
jgi:predicted amidophosphoribosyltransferase